MCVLKINAHT